MATFLGIPLVRHIQNLPVASKKSGPDKAFNVIIVSIIVTASFLALEIADYIRYYHFLYYS
jgi:hypothetical protein